MKPLLPTMTLLALATLAVPARAQNVPQPQSLFTGDVKLACEAILCLSTGSPPNQCAPSLQKYYSLHQTSKYDLPTAQKRLNFLNQCPTASQDARMRALVDAIVHAAGYCKADNLNSALVRPQEVTQCKPNPQYGFGNLEDAREICTTEMRNVISSALPGHCSNYYLHDYIRPNKDAQPPRYVGDPLNGGRWQD